ncbi:MAG: hypothetical protein OEL76_15600 [Siculibacillus sp.]|nr:hypothetical protein [Siculibacillus sp.]
MGDVVQFSQLRRSHLRRRSQTGVSETGTIALFTGVRIERWSERDPEPGDAARTRPTRPRGRRRSS